MYRHIFVTEAFNSEHDSFLSSYAMDALRNIGANFWIHFFPDAGGSSHYMHGYIDHAIGESERLFDDVPCKMSFTRTKLP